MFKIDMHMHSFLSYDSKEAISCYVEAAKSLGIDGICLTEHDRWKFNNKIEEQRYEIAEEVAEDHGILLLRNTEFSTEYGHILVYGNPESMPIIDELIKTKKQPWPTQHKNALNFYVPLEELCKETGKKGLILAPAHPYRNNGILVRGYKTFKEQNPNGDYENYMKFISLIFNICESHNGMDIPNRLDIIDQGVKFCEKYDFKQLGGSDAHNLGMFGNCYTTFNNRINHSQDLIRELELGNYKPELSKEYTKDYSKVA